MTRPLSLLMTMALALCLTPHASAQCAGRSCAVPGGYGLFGGWQAPAVTYHANTSPMLHSTHSTARYYSSSGYTRDANGYLIAPDGARVTAINGTLIGPSKTVATPIESVATTATCECDCKERIDALEQRIVALEDTRPFYATDVEEPAEHKEPGWRRAIAERGKPAPGYYHVMAAR